MEKQLINQLIDETIDSGDNLQRASPKAFLLTRVNARMAAKENFWEKAIAFIGKPAIAIPGVAMVVLINITVIVFKKAYPVSSSAEQSLRVQQPDDFSYAVTALYDIENTEP